MSKEKTTMTRKGINRYELKRALQEVKREMDWLTRVLDEGDDLLEQDYTRIAMRTTVLLSYMSRLIEAQSAGDADRDSAGP